MMLMELLNEAGCPPGVVNVIHGAHEAVNFICDHPDIKAISFVGSDTAVSKCGMYYVHLAAKLQVLSSQILPFTLILYSFYLVPA
jgi:acyl-CoA reductase-like NAD-dependent aldehyde dehydrogenase